LVYLIVEILGLLIAAAALGVVVGWLCRSLTAPRPPRSSADRTRAGQREQEAQQHRIEELEARLAEAVDGTKALQEELAQARKDTDAATRDLRTLEQEQRTKLEERDAEAARLRAALESSGGRVATPLPPHTVSSPMTPGRLEVAAPDTKEADAQPPEVEVAEAAGPEVPQPEVGSPPRGLVAPQGAADDLKRINGIGSGIERALNENGIFHYRQIAELSPSNLIWLDHHLRLKGRIEREDWIGQARTLLGEAQPLASQK